MRYLNINLFDKDGKNTNRQKNVIFCVVLINILLFEVDLTLFLNFSHIKYFRYIFLSLPLNQSLKSSGPSTTYQYVQHKKSNLNDHYSSSIIIQKWKLKESFLCIGHTKFIK